MSEACLHCRGDGYYYRVPDGFNPFSAGLMASARSAYRVECYHCTDASPAPKAPGSETR